MPRRSSTPIYNNAFTPPMHTSNGESAFYGQPPARRFQVQVANPFADSGEGDEATFTLRAWADRSVPSGVTVELGCIGTFDLVELDQRLDEVMAHAGRRVRSAHVYVDRHDDVIDDVINLLNDGYQPTGAQQMADLYTNFFENGGLTLDNEDRARLLQTYRGILATIDAAVERQPAPTPRKTAAKGARKTPAKRGAAKRGARRRSR